MMEMEETSIKCQICEKIIKPRKAGKTFCDFFTLEDGYFGDYLGTSVQLFICVSCFEKKIKPLLRK